MKRRFDWVPLEVVQDSTRGTTYQAPLHSLDVVLGFTYGGPPRVGILELFVPSLMVIKNEDVDRSDLTGRFFVIPTPGSELHPFDDLRFIRATSDGACLFEWLKPPEGLR